MSDDTVRYNVQMPRQLREDAKRNSKRGELAEEVRGTFRRIAYGEGAAGQPTEVEKTKAELREVRNRIDTLRVERGKIDNEIQQAEARSNRLEERLTELEERRSEIDSKAEMLETMLRNGQRLWPTFIKNNAGIDPGAAEELFQQLRDENADLPDVAFQEPGVHEPADWREVDDV